MASEGEVSERTWHYTLDGDMFGPLSVPDMRALRASGQIDAETLVWSEGLGTWTPYGKTELSRPPEAITPPPEPEPEVVAVPAASVPDEQKAEAPAIEKNAASTTAPSPSSTTPSGGDLFPERWRPASERETVALRQPNRRQGLKRIDIRVVGFAVALVAAVIVALMLQPRSTGNGAPNPQGAQEAISASAARWSLSVASSRWTDGSQHLETLKTISPIDGQLIIDDTTHLLVTSPNFLEDHHLLLVYDESWNAGRLALFFISDERGNLYRLDGLSPVINILHNKVRVNSDNVEAYLRFFNLFTRATEGPFLVVQSASDVMAPRLTGDARMAEAESHYAPVDCQLEDRTFQCLATIFYSNAVFLARFSVDRAGVVNMTGDEPKVQGLPVRPDFPINRR